MPHIGGVLKIQKIKADLYSANFTIPSNGILQGLAPQTLPLDRAALL